MKESEIRALRDEIEAIDGVKKAEVAYIINPWIEVECGMWNFFIRKTPKIERQIRDMMEARFPNQPVRLYVR